MRKPVVLVTGTSTGIGRACVPMLAAAGCHVVATARRPEAIADLAGPSVDTMPLDVTSARDREEALDAVWARHGRLDVLVNNAGYGAMLAVEDTPADAMRRMFETNVFGLHELARLALPRMRAQGGGRIVNVASVAAHASVPLMGSYCATKFAVRALTQALDMEARRFGVRGILVEPGVIRTEFGMRTLAETQAGVDMETSPYRPLYRKWAASRTRRGGGRPEAIGRLIVKAATARRPRNNYRAPVLGAKAAILARRLLPDAWVMAGMRAYFR